MNNEVICQKCNIKLSDDENFCSNCGKELKQECPICHNRCLLNASINPFLSRCPNCNSVLFACDKCGRWHKPGGKNEYMGICEDPVCKGTVKSQYLVYTGRFCNNINNLFTWKSICEPSELRVKNHDSNENQNKDTELEKCENLQRLENQIGDTYAGAIANNELVVWCNKGIFSSSINESVNDLKLKFVTPDIVPADIDSNKLITVLGDHIVLAAKDGFYLCIGGEAESFYDGKPYAQVSNHRYWAGAINNNEYTVLLIARITGPNESPEPKEIDVSDIISDNIFKCIDIISTEHNFYFLLSNSMILKYNIDSEIINKEYSAPSEYEINSFWINDEQIGGIMVKAFNSYLCKTITYSDKLPLDDYNNICVTPSDYMIIGNKNLTVYKSNNDIPSTLGFINKGYCCSFFVNSHIINDCKSDWMYFLLKEAGNGLIKTTNIESGTTYHIYTIENIEPISMLPTDDEIFVIHKKGVISLS